MALNHFRARHFGAQHFTTFGGQVVAAITRIGNSLIVAMGRMMNR